MRSLGVITLVAVTMTAMSAADGTATGTFTVKGKASKMAHAYAMNAPNPMDKAKKAIRLVVSDVPIDAKALADPTPFGIGDLSKAGKLHAIDALISLPDKAVLGTMLFDAAFKMSSVSVAGTNLKLTVKTLTATSISGRLYTEKPDDFNDVPFSFDVAFTAPIRP